MHHPASMATAPSSPRSIVHAFWCDLDQLSVCLQRPRARGQACRLSLIGRRFVLWRYVCHDRNACMLAVWRWWLVVTTSMTLLLNYHLSLQAELDNGAGVAALRRFNDNLRKLPADRWGEWLYSSGQPCRWPCLVSNGIRVACVSGSALGVWLC